MNKPTAQVKKKSFLGLSSKEVKGVMATYTKEELLTVLKAAEDKSENIRAREDIYVERVPDEIMKKPFEIVR
ncbi:hypothetical protein HNP38_002381 [Chryseobacterium defluvii]|uniref:Uncharacterized protein n=1 Tax=Chryseobacterium defluvii TaxID=160396 RepID=A0A840KGH9_9FLAO|nr:hypothetical protein [Chryseobacterium defluvii]MBB4807077.1 hypothetical protein [Chryseobacterium defluvii]